jgi:type VI secretion system protein ImpF
MAHAQTPARARAPLFDRLVDHELRQPTESQPRSTLSRAELQASVRQEVEWLLNTRCPIPAHDLDNRARSVVDYGVPDCSLLTPHSQRDHQRLEQLFSHAITAFEPRLRHVRVTVERRSNDHTALVAHIEAVLVVASIREPMAFPVLVQNDVGRIDSHARAG